MKPASVSLVRKDAQIQEDIQTVPVISQIRMSSVLTLLRTRTATAMMMSIWVIPGYQQAIPATDVLTKILGTNNPHNVVKATLVALDNMMDVRMTADKRDISVREVFEA